MAAIRKTGNLIDMAEAGLFDVIVHGCNCYTTMGSGIAKEIKERYPAAYRVDKQWPIKMVMPYIHTPELRLGNFSFAVVEAPPTAPHYLDCERKKFTIVNAYTQVGFMPRDVDHFEYASFELILRKLLSVYGDRRVGLPYIGMGLAGGDPEKIIPIIDSYGSQFKDAGGSLTLVRYG